MNQIEKAESSEGFFWRDDDGLQITSDDRGYTGGDYEYALTKQTPCGRGQVPKEPGMHGIYYET